MGGVHVEDRMELRFHEGAQSAGTHENLSAIRQDGPYLWIAGDETATIERLTSRDGVYDDQRTFDLADFVDLPAGRDAEADIEGLARTDGWLWAVGSHSLKRRRLKPGHSADKARRRLATVLREENRFVLVRLPLRDGVPVRADGRRRAAVLSGDDNLADMLSGDPHLAPFLKLPGKDNGLDIEGIAARPDEHGDRLYVGLRGPVLRGWAVLLEIRPATHPRDPSRLRLAEPYRTHFLDLDGLGVRDLCPYGDDLLILTGPSMDLDGPVRVVRWRNGSTGGVVAATDLETVTELPYGRGEDHPEGLAVLDDGRLIVVYDSPSPERRTAAGVYADLIRLD
ncbi:DUF3616 domain-containing protein [Planotetraspora kaengkrachanensis]|uniref:DUF3616 domain-containing protein n=1 Tax=Planotetraspora kaengkrachanensis TaxID=575193 RepID=A0A8J3M189_9ACTN|nr:hypothetical protein Pka01_06410 [Planotetraspora kaengkrachanensis]